MPAERDDSLLRLVTQAATALRRFRERLKGGTPPREIADEARAAAAELLGPRASLVAMMDATSAVGMVGDPERVRVWAGLLRVEADALRQLGDGARADWLDARASALEAALPH